MATIYDKIDAALKRIRQVQVLIRQGLARPEEKVEAFQLAQGTAANFTNDLFKRKVEKLERTNAVWTKQTRDGFVAPDEADQLNDWIALFEEYKEARKIKAELSSNNVHIQSVVDGEDQHIFITEKGSDSHAQLILDGGTGEIRIDPNDQNPHELIKSISAKLELRTGEVVQITKSKLSFVGQDLENLLKIELDGNPGFSANLRTADQVAGIFQVSISVLFKNLSDKKITIRNIKPLLQLPEGYNVRLFHTNLDNPQDIPSEEVLAKVFQFAASIDDGGSGVANLNNPAWAEAKQKIENALTSAKIEFILYGECVSFAVTNTIVETFDISETILPELKK